MLSPTRNPGRFSRKDYLIFLLILVCCAAAFGIIPPQGLSSNDEGARYIQMRNFTLYGTLPIQYPGLALGLQSDDVAKQHEVFFEREGKLYSGSPPLFSYLSGLFYPVFGERAVTFLPLLALFVSVLILGATLRLLVHAGLLYYVLLFGFLLASPVYTYAIRFAEHVPAACLALCSLYFLVRYFRVKPALSGLCLSVSLLSAGMFFRPEVVLLTMPYAGYLGLTLVAQRQVRQAGAVLACALAPVVLYALVNRTLYGGTLLVHLFNIALGFHFSARQAALALGTLLLAAMIAYLAKKSSAEVALKRQLYTFVPVLFIPFVVLVSAFSPAPVLFLAFPLVLLIFFALPERVEKLLSEPMSLGNVLFVTIGGFLFLVSWPFANNAAGGIGYCLPAIPFIIVLVAQEGKRLSSAKPIVALAVLLLVFSACYQAYTVKTTIWNYKQYNAERIRFLHTATEPGAVIICDKQARLEHGGPLFFDRVFMVAENGPQFAHLIDLLNEKQIKHAYLWAGFTCLPTGTSYSASKPAVFSDSRGPKNYLYTLTLKQGDGGERTKPCGSCGDRGTCGKVAKR